METHLADWVYWWYIYPACIVMVLKLWAIIAKDELDKGLVSKLFGASIDAVIPVFNLFYLLGVVLLAVRSALGKKSEL